MKGLSNQQKEILKEIAIVGGVIALAIIAPNAIQLFRSTARYQRRQKDSFKRSLTSLETRGLIRHQNGKVSLTHAGRHLAQAAIYRGEARNQPAYWDKKWRIVMFDIPEREKDSRGRFRYLLKEYGFVQIQKSVYISPYDFLANIHEIVRDGRLTRYITLVETEMIEAPRNLLVLFNLK